MGNGRIFLFHRAAILTLIVFTARCSWIEGGSPEPKPFEPFQSPGADPAPVVSTPAATEGRTAESAATQPELPQYIEITWEIPAEKVEGYVIRYGTEKENLDHIVRLAPGDVQKTRHTKYGEVFRYLVPNPPKDKTVYISVAAVSKGNESAPSNVFEVAPDSKAAATPKVAPPSTSSSEPAAPRTE